MDRRDFLKTTSTVIAGSSLAPGLLAGKSLSRESDVQGRLVLPLNRNWRYNRSFVKGAHEREFDDSAFERVVIPHANVRLPWHSFDDKEYEFVSIYRRRFRLPQEARGRRVFIDFEGAMTASTVWINGVRLGEYKGGYTPFSFDLTPHIEIGAENVLAVDLDSTERPDIPPFGYQIDYLTFGGIYREVWLRIVPATFIENIFAKPKDVLTEHPGLDVDCYVQHTETLRETLTIEAELREGDQVVAKARERVAESEATTEAVAHSVHFEKLDGIKLWELENPNLYTVQVRLLRGSEVIDQDSRRIGFREAQFTDHGFELNGKILKLRGLDRHQTFPFVGQAMAGRAQRNDARILRKNLKCNIVRTSHYPQSRHFLDACDEMGLLVLEEIPGWQHIGDEAWKLISIDNVRRMIRRDWNHPSIILWGVGSTNRKTTTIFTHGPTRWRIVWIPHGKRAASAIFRRPNFWKTFSPSTISASPCKSQTTHAISTRNSLGTRIRRRRSTTKSV
ncbi:MAG: glycoside hydrolase family 2 TIM barrel-domain containing protein [Candidatus Acidiferrum sp.]